MSITSTRSEPVQLLHREGHGRLADTADETPVKALALPTLEVEGRSIKQRSWRVPAATAPRNRRQPTRLAWAKATRRIQAWLAPPAPSHTRAAPELPIQRAEPPGDALL